MNRYARNVNAAEEYLTNRGVSLDIARQWKLGVVVEPDNGHESYRGRLCIPYLTPAGVVDVKFRCMRDHVCKEIEGHQKYLAPEGSTARLFGVWNLRADSPVICLCEGEMDTIACTSIAGLPAVGISGVKKWRDWWPFVFEGYEEVIILWDGDEAGTVAAKTVAGRIYNSRIVTMPNGYDVNELLAEQGPEALHELIGLDEDED